MSAVVAVPDDKTDKPWEVCCELSIAEQWEGNHTIYIYTYTYIPTLYITFPFQSTGKTLSYTLSVLASGRSLRPDFIFTHY